MSDYTKKKVGFKNLKTWSLAIDVAAAIYKFTDTLPAEERFGITSQLRRAAVSISSNIAEGWARGTQANLVNGLRIARGSLCEVESLLEVVRRLGYGDEKMLDALEQPLDNLGRKLYLFMQKAEASYVREGSEIYESESN